MSNTIVAVFPSTQPIQTILDEIRNIDPQAVCETMAGNESHSHEEQSLKLDGIISGVSDTLIKTAPFVNPMSTIGLPAQQPSPNLSKPSRSMTSHEDLENQISRHQNLVKKGKAAVIIKTESDSGVIEKVLEKYTPDNIKVFSS